MTSPQVEAIGLVAGFCTTLAFVPQVVKAWRTRRTRDLSLGMYLVLAAGVALWLAYGLLIGSVSVVAANAATLVLVVVVLKLRHG
ncbi:MAG: SemiSWEET transporter [Thermodesulfobacteriota bacterium]